MQRLLHSKFLVAVLSVSILGAGYSSASWAGMIGTQTLLAAQTLDESRTRVNAFIARAQVSDRFIELGADPAEVQARVSALTDDELQEIESRIDEMPAGGILGTIGLVFIILLILEITGVIDIFKKV
jgi:hypothetical protein